MNKIILYNNKDLNNEYIIQTDLISDLLYWFDNFTIIDIEKYDKDNNDLIELSNYTYKQILSLSKRYDVKYLCLVSKDINIKQLYRKEKEKNDNNV